MAIGAYGRAHIAGRVPEGTTVNPMIYMAIGTGTPSTTALGNEISRIMLTSDNVVDNVITYIGNWTADNYVEGEITEAGIFNVDNVMLLSGEFDIIKTIYDNLQVTFELTI